jgi:hypothetical protein
MPYIGKQPLTGAYQLCDTITTSATATYNLTVGGSAVIPGSAQNCIVSLNGVIQAPVGAFTVSGSQITFASALTSTDVIDFILILGNVFDIGTPTNGSVTNSSLNSNVITGQTAVTVPATDDVLLCYDTSATDLRKITFANFGNTPSFRAYLSTNMTSVALSTETKVTYQSESWDTDNAFDSTTNYRYTIPANKGGKYFFGANVTLLNSAAYKTFSVLLYKNGSEEYRGSKLVFTLDTLASSSYSTLNMQTIIDAAASDYFEIFIEIQSASGTGTLLSGTRYNNFYGFRLIGV